MKRRERVLTTVKKKGGMSTVAKTPKMKRGPARGNGEGRTNWKRFETNQKKKKKKKERVPSC